MNMLNKLPACIALTACALMSANIAQAALVVTDNYSERYIEGFIENTPLDEYNDYSDYVDYSGITSLDINISSNPVGVAAVTGGSSNSESAIDLVVEDLSPNYRIYAGLYARTDLVLSSKDITGDAYAWTIIDVIFELDESYDFTAGTDLLNAFAFGPFNYFYIDLYNLTEGTSVFFDELYDVETPLSYNGTLGPGRYQLFIDVYSEVVNVQDLGEAGGDFVMLLTPATTNDTDGDGIVDSLDNCTLVYNPPQRDTDSDGFGNDCDPDFDNNLVVNAADLAYFKTKFFTSDPDADLNGNGVVNAADLAILKTFFFKPPGPSGLAP